MKLLRALLFLTLILLAFPAANATTVIPPTFDELVTRAETIFEGTVTGMRSEWTGEGANRHIVTYVTFKIEDAIKGKDIKSTIKQASAQIRTVARPMSLNGYKVDIAQGLIERTVLQALG